MPIGKPAISDTMSCAGLRRPIHHLADMGRALSTRATGQILGADIMLEFAFLRSSLRYDKLFDNAIPNVDSDMPQYCSLGHELHASNLFGTQALRVSGASKIEVDALLKESIYFLILHEIGHTLGLNHNMKSSQLHTPAQLHDKSRTSKMGLTGSVMDYPGVNLALPDQKQGHYYTTRPGPYDIWAIEFGYSPGQDNIKDEQKRLEKILARSTEPELMFGNDADDMRSSNRGIDPRVMIYDLSNDAIAHATGRIELVNDVKNKILAKYNTPGQHLSRTENGLSHSHGAASQCRNRTLPLYRRHLR